MNEGKTDYGRAFKLRTTSSKPLRLRSNKKQLSLITGKIAERERKTRLEHENKRAELASGYFGVYQ